MGGQRSICQPTKTDKYYSKNMAIITNKQLFVWSDFEKSNDLDKLSLVLQTIPDEKLMKILEDERGASGVNKYPIRAIWNSLIAGIVYEHKTIESLRRELKRNPLLMHTCGFNIFHGSDAVPSSGSYSRFQNKLLRHKDEIRKIFQSLLKLCFDELPDFGENLAIDGKALSSFAKNTGTLKDDRRGDHEANWGKHVTRCEGSDGKTHEKIKSWFGYTLHLIVDSKYELPVDFTVLPASSSEIKTSHLLIDRIGRENLQILERAKCFSGDRGYDDTKLHVKLWDDYDIKPIIDIRRSWKDGEETKEFEKYRGVVYDNKGRVSCISPHYGEQKKMACSGFEKDRNCLSYLCPAEHYGIECKSKAFCNIPNKIRIPLSEDRRIFSPVARDSYKWKSLYNHRTAIERVNSRIDKMFGFDNHTIRGLGKMGFRVNFAFIIMLSFAVGKVRQKKPEELRQFLRA